MSSAAPGETSAAAASLPTTCQLTADHSVRFAARVFLAFLAIYLAAWGGHYTSADGAYKIALAKRILHLPTTLESKYGVGHSLVAIPPIAATFWIRRLTGRDWEEPLYTLVFIFNGAIFLALLCFYLNHFYPPGPVWATVVTIGLATTWWPYTKLDFSEPLVLTCLFAGFVLARFGHPFAGMLIAGFAITIRVDAALLVAMLGLWCLATLRSRAIIPVILALILSLAFVAAANWMRYRSVLDYGYTGEGFSTPLLVGLYGSLFSAGKSIFLFSPPLLLGCAMWRRFAANPSVRRDAWFFLGTLGLPIFLYAKWWDWSSDNAWGDRFLVPGVILMCIPVVEAFGRRALLATAVTLGVAIQLLAVVVGGLAYAPVMLNPHATRKAVWNQGRNHIDLDDLRFNPEYSQIHAHWILVRYLLHCRAQRDPLDRRS